MAKRFALHPSHPERICWGCDLYCPAQDLRCGNGTVRTPHPAELFGEDWADWGLDRQEALPTPEPASPLTAVNRMETPS